jgi:hypothetical protein
MAVLDRDAAVMGPTMCFEMERPSPEFWPSLIRAVGKALEIFSNASSGAGSVIVDRYLDVGLQSPAGHAHCWPANERALSIRLSITCPRRDVPEHFERGRPATSNVSSPPRRRHGARWRR